MNVKHNELPGYLLYEYLIVLSLPPVLKEKIMEVKKAFAEKYDASANTMGSPHITLVRFTQMQMMEEKILNRLKNIATGVCPFKVQLKDYSSLPTHTVCLNLATKVEIQKLVKNLQQANRLMKSPEVKPYFIKEPYIPIARKLLPWQYEKGYLEMSNLHFTGAFIADDMLLLKRKQGDKTYQKWHQLAFLNLPVTTKQGDLFSQK